MTRPVIAIDGPAGSGKSTVGRALAVRLGFRYVDTGAMYRAIALAVLAQPDPESALAEAGELARHARLELGWEVSEGRFSIALDGRDVSLLVRSAEAALWASRVAALPAVREELVARQRELARGGGVVMEGRDIGTVVCPAAEVKLFLEADLAVRGARRDAEEGRGVVHVVGDLDARDRADTSRSVAPLKPAPDAWRLDTSRLSAAEVVEQVLERLRDVGLLPA